MNPAEHTFDTALLPRWIIPVEPQGQVLENHAVLLAEGRISAVAPRSEVPADDAATRVELPEHVLLPGFVNTHGHAPMALLRGVANDLPLETWLEDHVWPLEQALMSPEFVRDGTWLAGTEMLRGGTTCFSDMYFFPDVVGDTASSLGIKACVGLIVIDFPSAWAASAEEYFAKAQEVHDRFRRNPLVRTAFAPHAPYSVNEASLAKVQRLAEELDVQVHTHVHETANEVQQSLTRYGCRPLARLRDLGLVNERLMAVHATQLLPAEIELLAAQGVHVLHCPESNLQLASGTCPVTALRAAGVNVALGTDSAVSNNDLDMLGEMRAAALLAKHATGAADALTAGDVLTMATLNGAKALGLDHEIGSIAPGKAADLVAVDLSAPRSQPVHDPLNQVVYAAGADQVTDVWVEGRRQVRDGQLVDVDLAGLRERTEYWRERVAQARSG